MSGDDSENKTRRGVLSHLFGPSGIAGAIGLGFLAGTASADDGSASGQIATAAEPALETHTEELYFHPRSSHPSNPDDGTMYYNDSP